MKHITVLQGQTIFDIALEQYGHVSGVSRLIKDNPDLDGLNANLSAGDRLLIAGPVIDQEMVDYFSKQGIRPVTGFSLTGGYSNGFSNGFKQ